MKIKYNNKVKEGNPRMVVLAQRVGVQKGPKSGSLLLSQT